MANRPTILVVEDEPVIAECLVTVLSDEGFDVTVASSAEAAVAIIDSGAMPKVLVTDVLMPGRLKGWELARYARALRPELGVIYTTGHAEADWASEGVPGSVLIPKPYALSQIVTAACTLLNITRGG